MSHPEIGATTCSSTSTDQRGALIDVGWLASRSPLVQIIDQKVALEVSYVDERSWNSPAWRLDLEAPPATRRENPSLSWCRDADPRSCPDPNMNSNWWVGSARRIYQARDALGGTTASGTPVVPSYNGQVKLRPFLVSNAIGYMLDPNLQGGSIDVRRFQQGMGDDRASCIYTSNQPGHRGAGSPVLRIVRGDELWVRFAVSEDRLDRVAVGRQLDVVVPAAGFRASATLAARGEESGWNERSGVIPIG